MGELELNKKGLKINLSIKHEQNNNLGSILLSPSASKSPRNFKEPNGGVGLGIVVALNESDPNSGRGPVLSASPRSNPIPIFTPNFVNGSKKTSSLMVSNSSAGNAQATNDLLEFEPADFLTSCYLCDKMLQGLDIFIYRGDKAFCSAECRCKQIASDERTEKRISKANAKRAKYSSSPCSDQLQFLAGVAAA